MGLFDWLWSLFTGARHTAAEPEQTPLPVVPTHQLRWSLTPRRPFSGHVRSPLNTVPQRPHAFAWRRGPEWLDLTQDGDTERLRHFGFPDLKTPADLAAWLQITPGELAWLAGRFWDAPAAESLQKSHYHYSWHPKRKGGRRLIEAPKPCLRFVQNAILRSILDRVPPHAAAHGFVTGRSNITNAQPHVGQNVLLKFDLRNFYPSVGYSRVTAIFRALGFNREVSIWLARLTTTAAPRELLPRHPDIHETHYLRRHLPQGAPTSPALANLSSFALDLRLTGLARTFHATYTRYADDLTFSGGVRFRRSLKAFIPLVRQIIRQERFVLHRGKLRIERRSSRQAVTGVVVNDRINVRREEFDRLKAILTNCLRHGPTSQNREGHRDFAAHLRGRIAYVQALNPARGVKLLALYAAIDWTR